MPERQAPHPLAAPSPTRRHGLGTPCCAFLPRGGAAVPAGRRPTDSEPLRYLRQTRAALTRGLRLKGQRFPEGTVHVPCNAPGRTAPSCFPFSMTPALIVLADNGLQLTLLAVCQVQHVNEPCIRNAVTGIDHYALESQLLGSRGGLKPTHDRGYAMNLSRPATTKERTRTRVPVFRAADFSQGRSRPRRTSQGTGKCRASLEGRRLPIRAAALLCGGRPAGPRPVGSPRGHAGHCHALSIGLTRLARYGLILRDGYSVTLHARCRRHANVAKAVAGDGQQGFGEHLNVMSDNAVRQSHCPEGCSGCTVRFATQVAA